MACHDGRLLVLDAEDGAIDPLSLSARVRRHGGRLAMEEELPRFGTRHATQHDPAAVRLDRLGRAQGPSSGD